MINKFFSSKIIPHDNVNSINGSYCQETRIVSRHGEIARKEYSYQWNSDGIRWREFSEKPEIITIGCSMTFGTGMPIDKIWPSILEQKIKDYGVNLKIGNLSYNGGSISKNINSLFGLIHQYQYIPKIIIANFADFERSYFPSQNLEYMSDVFWYPDLFIMKSYAPHDWPKMLPIEWIHYNNYQHIRQLELFCKYSGIELIWTSWYDYEDRQDSVDQFLLNNFDNYIKDSTKKEFSTKFQQTVPHSDKNNINKYYECYDDSCHKEQQSQNWEIFNFAYDHQIIPVDYIDGSPPLHPHPGMHRHLHWAGLFFNSIKGIIDKQ